MGHMNDLSEFVVPVGEHQGTCFIARVECVDEERAELMLATERVSAQRAVSCLIALQAGDTVSVIRDNENVYYIIAVLRREATGTLEVFSRHALSIHSASSIHLTAATSIELDAGDRVRLHAPWFEVFVDRFAAFAKTFSVTAGEALLNCKVSGLCSELINVIAQRIGVSARHAHRQIDGTEQLRCRHLDMQVTEVAHVRARTTLVKAKDLVKVDASQIQIG